MDIDPDIANWVLEFLLRQPLDDRILTSLLSALPLTPNDNPSLKKSILLRELARNSISERTLDLLEQLEEIEFRRGSETTASDSMQKAYCAVAVECTLKHSVNRVDFFEAVKRVWKWRVVEKGGVLFNSDELMAWKDAIESAVWEEGSVGVSLVKKSGAEGVDAVEAVKGYVREEREKMGPSFLEMVAARVKGGDEVIRGILGMENGGDRAPPPSGRDKDICNEVQKETIKLRDKLVGLRRLRDGRSRGAKIVDPDETMVDYDLPSSAEVKRVREALGSSAAELHAAVKDPLPDALRFAEGILGEKKRDDDHVKENRVQSNKCDDRVEEEKRVESDLFIVDGAGVIQSCGGNGSGAPKPSLMEWNSTTARAYERDGSNDGSRDDPASRGLPCPRMINVSPLVDRHEEAKNLKKRRRGRKWSLVEEETLRDGVKKYGKGNWKVILTVYRDVFEERTEVDLKDKWRNLTRH